MPMHLGEPDQREAFDALSRMEQLRLRLREWAGSAQLCQTAGEAVGEAERLDRAMRRTGGR